MPVYDYRCTDCGTKYDVYHKGHEVMEDIVCPACCSKHHKKLMSIPAVMTGSRSYNAGGFACESSGNCDSCEFN